jgi:hypothetical protein
MSKDEIAKLMQRTSEVAANGKYEQYKTSHVHDGTMQNPQWLA